MNYEEIFGDGCFAAAPSSREASSVAADTLAGGDCERYYTDVFSGRFL